jgi:hypothetical protein
MNKSARLVRLINGGCKNSQRVWSFPVLNDSNVLISRACLYRHAACAQIAAFEDIGDGSGTARGNLNMTNSKAGFRATRHTTNCLSREEK